MPLVRGIAPSYVVLPSVYRTPCRPTYGFDGVVLRVVSSLLAMRRAVLVPVREATTLNLVVSLAGLMLKPRASRCHVRPLVPDITSAHVRVRRRGPPLFSSRLTCVDPRPELSSHACADVLASPTCCSSRLGCSRGRPLRRPATSGTVAAGSLVVGSCALRLTRGHDGRHPCVCAVGLVGRHVLPFGGTRMPRVVPLLVSAGRVVPRCTILADTSVRREIVQGCFLQANPTGT